MRSTLDTAMIFAAGRGERMRPLTDSCPKPLLKVGGKALIVRQVERLASAGFQTIVVNHAWLGEQIEAALGDGSCWGVRLMFSPEVCALETAGGIAQARPLLEAVDGPQIFMAISGDIYCEFDYASLRQPAARLAQRAQPGMHLVMVPNPPFHPAGDFSLRQGQLFLNGAPRYTFANIGLYDTRMFHALTPGTRAPLTPYYRETIAAGHASGELYDGVWENIGTPTQLHTLDAMLIERERALSVLNNRGV